MATVQQTRELPPEILEELREAARHVAEGVRNPDIVRQACERMDRLRAEIQQKHGKRVSILSIMNDEQRGDTESAVSEGKLTWNVHWDGFRGPVATRSISS